MKTRILIVDDEPDIVQALADGLAAEGYHLFSAQNPEQFRTIALLEKFDLIILDIDLGSENGPDVYRDLLSMGLDAKIPVIFLSGLVPENLCRNSLGSGQRYSMHAKPFEYDKLMRDVRILTGTSSSSAA